MNRLTPIEGEKRNHMSTIQIVLVVVAMVVGILYLQRRRARLSRDEN
jgi:hypothetical protein